MSDSVSVLLSRATLAVMLALNALGIGQGQDAPVGATTAPSKPSVSEPGTTPKISYSRDIRPLLSDRCFLCHGPDEKTRGAELRLDSFDDAIDGGAIEPGDADASELIQRIISGDKGYEMPPASSHKAKLKPDEIAIIKQWINEGANYEKHWAFESPRRPTLPVSDLPAWNISPIDRLVIARLAGRGLQPAPPADRRTLLRRASFDLVGLPPTPTQIEMFLADKSVDAWSNALDRLLASPAYGEHQARHWLDVSRYADSNGYQYDFSRDQWAWRDWVIDSFNRNQPFDQFTIEQLAGDLIPGSTPQQRLATGFNRNHPITVEGGVIDEEYRTEYVLDRTTTAGTAWLGLTVGCARCHTHKYDPITQTEFYELSAFFNQIPEKGMKGFFPDEQIPSPFQVEAIDNAKRKVDAAESQFAESFDRWGPDLAEFEAEASLGWEEGWEVIRPTIVTSDGKATMNVLGDGSVQVSGANPSRDNYTMWFDADGQPIYAIRLTAMPSGPDDKPLLGRSSNGNFVLSEIETKVSSKRQPKKFESVKLTAAFADFSQSGYDVAFAIDSALDSKGWAVLGDQGASQSRTAIVVPATDLAPASGGKLQVTLKFQSGFSQHQMGRFQIAFARKPKSALLPAALPVLNKPADQRTAADELAIRQWITQIKGSVDVKAAMNAVSEARKKQAELLAEVPKTMVMKEMDTPRKTYVLDRGEYDKYLDAVLPGTPAFLPPMPAGVPNNRLGLAHWLTMPSHPLTSRVAVNRLWSQLFGIGLLDTPEDFGLQSSLPKFPELLDWLAVEFVESGWDVKAIFKTVMMSQVYQQSSVTTQDSFANDPENRWLARGPRLRLDAESIRDSALAVSGLLNPKIGGPSVFPYHPAGLWMEVNNRPGYSSAYKQDTGDKVFRRGVYTFWKRTVPPPSMAVFDAPSREYCQVRRSRTNTPLQAFVMLHDPQYVEAARVLAEKMMAAASQNLRGQLAFGFETAIGRSPSEQELELLQVTYQERIELYEADAAKAEKLLSIGNSSRNSELPIIQHAAMTTVARVILNLSEFITKG
ncbi:PSD1 and planctomycete cytochrome C domain-containing protein [Rubripirellula reticaptiva]|uniref:Planctomycete cytochrome C n=1 Tax=Rubripirellula reticaptiva TaxID=2528013 RepID=A0A5C6FFH4_9BACT|nr:PSD1 and planctomycete cytochrome C domain-containing protein [Rubripirellula reticaptiva]TWU58341.1 Planctomycete cytochrome C [Rubripirellula reticaptiva]